MNNPTSQERVDPAADVQTVEPTADDATAQPQAGTRQTADELFDEQMRWCRAWALDNLEPIVYAEFLHIDPRNMDDIARTIWRERLYGSELLNDRNADRRNEQFKLECLSSIARRADFQWGRLAEAAYERDNPTAHEIPNQYVRIMRWMHLSGEELLDMEEPPRELLKLLRDYDYASEGNLYINIPTASAIEKARADHGDDFSIDWWGLHYAATSNSSPAGGPLD